MSIVISCDGTEGLKNKKEIQISRHPLVYFKVFKDKKSVCPYCGKEFTFNNYFK